MADYQIGNIEVQINSSTEKAIAGLKALSNAIKEVDTASSALSNLKLAAKAINSFSNSMVNFVKKSEGFKDVDTKISGLQGTFQQLAVAIDPFLLRLDRSRDSLVSFSSILTRVQSVNLSKVANQVDKVAKSTDKVGKSASKSGSFVKKLFTMTGYLTAINAAKRLGGYLVKVVGYASDYAETLNMFQVSFEDMYDTAYKMSSVIANSFGLSQETMMRYMATFNNMLKSLGNLSSGMTYELSQTLTRMAIDYSSLFNTSIATAMSAFQSVLAGSIRPIRTTSGYDVSETTIFAIYQKLGGSKTMRQLNMIEKRLLRIISLQNQMVATGAVGDYEKTIENFANQSRIFKEQIKELGRWVGTFVMLGLSPLLKFANAFVITFKEVVKAFSETFANANDLDLSEVYSGFTDVKENVDGTTDSVAELKRELLGFDKLNILGDNGKPAGAGEIDDKILNAMKQYKGMIENVSYKAKEISNSWLTWLGYVDVGNKELGETNWQLKEGANKISVIFATLKTTIAGVIATFAGKRVLDISKAFGNIDKVQSSLALLGKQLKGVLLSPLFLVAAAFAMLVMYSKDFRNAVINLVSVIGKAFAPVLSKMQHSLTIVMNALARFIDILGTILTPFINALTYIIEMASNFNILAYSIMAMISAILLIKVGILVFKKLGDIIKETTWLFTSFIKYIKRGDPFGSMKSTLGVLGLMLVVAGGLVAVFQEISPQANIVVGVLATLTAALTAAAVAWMVFHGAMSLGASVPVIIGAIAVGAAGIYGIVNGANNKKYNIPQLDKGGVFGKETLVNVAEYGNASTNPEVIAPQSILQQTFNASMLPIANAILQSNNSVISAIEKSGNRNVYLNSRKVSEELYNDTKEISKRRGELLFSK